MHMASVTRLQPLAVLREIEQRAKRHARGLPLKVEVKKTWPGVAFRIGDNHMVAPLNEVHEVLTYPRLTAVPGAKPWVKGVANIRGSLLPIIHLPAYLGIHSDPPNRRTRLLVVQHGGVYAGLMVDEVLGIKHFEEEERLNELPPTADATHPYLVGAYLRDGQYWRVYSTHRLAQNPLFLQAAV
ncbi:MAG: chemotaxis protein CheW [Gammaproteobacteria bacterium]|nr:chemotaxis protein CheW [Gammaproteobacteria bacterium]